MKKTYSDGNGPSFASTVKGLAANFFDKIDGNRRPKRFVRKETKGSKSDLFIVFIAFNRLGLTERNLSQILSTDENFEMHIIDSNSKDNSWDYIQSLTDSRIKAKIRFDLNRGPIYPLNLCLDKRRPEQYFMTIDSDVYILTPNWISRYMEVFRAFPEVGVLGVMRDTPYPRYLPPIIPKVKGDLSYLQLKNAAIGVDLDFVPGTAAMPETRIDKKNRILE